MKHTPLEVRVFNAALNECFYEAYVTVSELSNKTGLDIQTTKGVVGSLTKKGLIDADGGELNPVVDGELFSFGVDEYNDDEIAKFELK